MRNHSKAFRHFMIMMITGILILTGSLFCSGTANAKEGDCGNTSDGKFWYEVITDPKGKTPGKVSISAEVSGGHFGNKIVYPNTIIGKNKKKYTVVEIDGMSVDENDYSNVEEKITEITIPKNCETISDYAFEDMNIKKVTFESGSKLKKIGEEAFSTKKTISTITIPKSVVSIGAGAFNAGVLKVNFEKGSKFKDISKMKKGSYWWVNEWWTADEIYNYRIISEPNGNNPGKAELIMYDPKSTKKIASYTIPNVITNPANKKYSVYSIGEDCFACDESISNITIPKNCVIIGENAFMSCELKKVIFEKGSCLKEIDEAAFYSCVNLKEIVIPKLVERIGVAAFAYSGLRKITFESGSKLKFISGLAFDECDLGNVYLPNNNITFDTADLEMGSAFGTGNKTINLYCQ